MAEVLLCADEESLRNPALMGVECSNLDRFEWLECRPDAFSCRERVAHNSALSQIWVVSSDDMDAINLAAALKRDAPYAFTVLVSNEQSGSLASRARVAGIDEIWTTATLNDAVRAHSSAGSLAAGAGATGAAAGAGATGAAASAGATGAAASVGAASAGVSGGGVPCGVAAGDGLPQGALALVLPEVVAESQQSTGFAACFVSGTGGCGTSTLCALSALICARSGLKTAVLDADLQFGDMQRVLAADCFVRIDEVLSTPGRLGLMEAQRNEAAPFVIGPPERLEDAELLAEGVGNLVGALRQKYDVVLVNTGCMWSDIQAVLLENCDQVVMVMAPRVSSLHSTARAIDLCGRLGAATNRFCYVLNRQTRSSLLSALDASCAIRVSQVQEIPDGGRDVEELISAGMIAGLFEGKNEVVEAVRALLGELLPEVSGRMLKAADQPTRKRLGKIFGGSGA